AAGGGDGDLHRSRHGRAGERLEGGAVMDRSQGRVARPGAEMVPEVETFSGNRGLQLEEPLIFEQDSPGKCGVDLPEVPAVKTRLAGLERKGAIGLPGLSEPQIVQHYTRLSQKNYAIDSGLYPLGS